MIDFEDRRTYYWLITIIIIGFLLYVFLPIHNPAFYNVEVSANKGDFILTVNNLQNHLLLFSGAVYSGHMLRLEAGTYIFTISINYQGTIKTATKTVLIIADTTVFLEIDT